MNRTDRLLAIVLELQGRGRARAEDLARELQVSKRTVYRDVLALSEAGVPIVSAPGQGYRLMEGYFLPPLRFSAEEAVMLILGADVMAQSFDPQLGRAAESAARKIGAVLASDVQEEVRFLHGSLRLVQRDSSEELHGMVLTLRQATLERRTVRFRYHKRGAGEELRQVDPHGLFRLNGVWMLAAYDQGRAGLRTFRLDRMDDPEVTPDRFVRQPDFRLEREETQERRELVVRVLFDPEAARWVRQNPSYFVTGEEHTPDGLLVTLRARTPQEVLPWLLSWGGSAQVLEPESLKGLLREEARRMLRLYR